MNPTQIKKRVKRALSLSVFLWIGVFAWTAVSTFHASLIAAFVVAKVMGAE